MKCPYCDTEMKEGVISGSGRKRVCWKEGDDPPTMWEHIRRKGELQCVSYDFPAILGVPTIFQIGAVYCERCRLMMFKTDIWDRD